MDQVIVGAKLEGADGRFGAYLCVDCVKLPYLRGHNHYMSENSPDLTPKYLSLVKTNRLGNHGVRVSDLQCTQNIVCTVSH